jgi:hypothetical protein
MDDLCCTNILVVKIPCQLQSYYHSDIYIYIYIFACALLKHKTQLFVSDLMSLIWSNKAWLELAVNMEVCLVFMAKLIQSDFQFFFSISGGF